MTVGAAAGAATGRRGIVMGGSDPSFFGRGGRGES